MLSAAKVRIFFETRNALRGIFVIKCCVFRDFAVPLHRRRIIIYGDIYCSMPAKQHKNSIYKLISKKNHLLEKVSGSITDPYYATRCAIN